MSRGAFIYDVRCFSGIFDLPTYPHQILYYISLFSKIRWGFTYLLTQKSDVIYECSLMYTNIRELDVIKEDLDLTQSEDRFQFCIFEKFVLSFQSCSVRTILEKKEQKWKGWRIIPLLPRISKTWAREDGNTNPKTGLGQSLQVPT